MECQRCVGSVQQSNGVQPCVLVMVGMPDVQLYTEALIGICHKLSNMAAICAYDSCGYL